ncbi:A24 family peptidase [Microbacterium sp. W4I20]|uniref:prepilin peptidase n=1 Tax=Microbacterium sp. W4I20 TaxID=3042262 RepID=UPI002784204F|nr:A24 family peptidase [Microbacterium sp. W4I20]MDQ0725031.1 leader peptidase (prepilin peptidase)/N-methyltransferase [Microbacterium sp. W4I20]
MSEGGWPSSTPAPTDFPNRIVLPTLAALLLLLLIDAVVTMRSGQLIRALIGMLILGGFYLVLRMISRSGMGGGDVKLAAVIGLVLGWHGWQELAIGAASAFVMGALFALALLLLRRADGATRIAFGPWMIAGAFVGVVVG